MMYEIQIGDVTLEEDVLKKAASEVIECCKKELPKEALTVNCIKYVLEEAEDVLMNSLLKS